MNWIKNKFLKNNSDESYNECSEIKHSVDAPKSYIIPNENNINNFNSNFMNDDNKDVKYNTNTTESYLDEFQNYLEKYYKQQNENNTSDIIKRPSVSNNNNEVKLEHTTVNSNTEYEFSNTPENEKPFEITYETDESVIHQDILMKTDFEYFHQQNDDFNSTPEIISIQDVINNSCDIFNPQEIFHNTTDLEFEKNNVNMYINETDRDKVILAKHSGDVGNKESNTSTIIPLIVKNEVPITENMNGYQESPLGIQNFKENLTMVIDFDEKNTITFKVLTTNKDEMSNNLSVPFKHKREMTEDMFDGKSISTNVDSNKEIYKNTHKTELDIEYFSESGYESSTLRKEASKVINLDNIATIPVKLETEDDKETKMEINDKEIINCQNSRNISNENKIPFETEKIANNFKLLNKIKTSMNNELNMDVIIDLTDEQDIISLDSDDSDKESYHSSDFEFINEDEAMLNEVCFVERKVASSVFTKPNHVFPSEKIMEGYFDDRIAQSKDHSIPIGHSYYELFQGRYTPYPMQGMQNKCIGPRGCVGEGYRGVGFEVPRVDPVILPFDVRREASECANKIYNMYPVENPRWKKSTRNR